MRFLGSKYARNAYAAGAPPRTSLGGAYSAPPDPLAGFKGPTSKGRGGEAREGGMGGKGEEREGARRGEGKGRKDEGREGSEGGLTPTFLYLRCPCIQ